MEKSKRESAEQGAFGRCVIGQARGPGLLPTPTLPASSHQVFSRPPQPSGFPFFLLGPLTIMGGDMFPSPLTVTGVGGVIEYPLKIQ